MLRIVRLMIAVVVVAAGPLYAGDTLESVEKKIAAKWEKQRSASAKFTITQSMEMQGMKMNSKTTGTHEYTKDGDRQLHRMEMDMEMTQDAGGQSMKMTSKMLMIDDGELQYILTESSHMPQPMAMKTKTDPTRIHASGKAMFDSLRKQYELKLLPDETVNGKATYTIQATPKGEAAAGPMAPGKSVYYICKDTGMLVKSIQMDKAGKTTQTMIYSDIKLNVKLDASRFKFKAPEGVQIQDMTKQG